VTDVHPESQARMVDVTAKDVSERQALAECTVRMSGETLALVMGRALSKGDALEVARIAGIMAAKKTSELIPLCHPITIGAVDISFEPCTEGIRIQARVKTAERTGVEMEAMTAASISALTVYDMVKGTERGVEITGVRLLRKSGGRSGDWWREQPGEAESGRPEP
jgi:cyclic pyranopterin phosphate synthase